MSKDLSTEQMIYDKVTVMEEDMKKVLAVTAKLEVKSTMWGAIGGMLPFVSIILLWILKGKR